MPIENPTPEASAEPVVIPTSIATKQPELSSDQVRAMRQTWLENFNPESGETMDQWLAKFDAAAGVDGPAPIDAAAAAHDAKWNLSEAVAPSDYRPNYGDLARSLDVDHLAAVDTEAREFAAAMLFPKELGVGIIEHISQVGPVVAKMSSAEKDAWTRGQEAHGARSAGSAEAWEAVKAKASEALAAVDSPLAEALRSSPVLNSAWLIRTIANHSDTVAAWRQERPT